jgi:serine/threonine-protein kinase
MVGAASKEHVVGRYAIYDEIAAGGMATVHYGRLVGPVGFTRPVAIKRLHPHLARDPDFVTMFMDEARLAARIRHPNVVATMDIVSEGDQLLLVMEYVEGESLSRLLRRANASGAKPPIGVTCTILVGALQGLHAAHEAKNDQGAPLNLVHRDVSPQNIIVGPDGVPRILDFGVAKAVGRLTNTREGQLKGKLPYMAPELLANGAVTRSVDVYAAAIVLWEMLTAQRLFAGETEIETFSKIVKSEVEPPSKHNPDVPPALDAIVLRGLAREAKDRFATARDMARELEKAVPLATASAVGEWVESLAHESLQDRARKVAEIESNSNVYRGPISSSVETGKRVSIVSGVQTTPGAGSSPDLAEDLRSVELTTSDLASTSATSPGLLQRRPKWLPIAAGVGVLFVVGIGIAVASRGGDEARPPEPSAKVPPPTTAAALPKDEPTASAPALVTPSATIEPVAIEPSATATAKTVAPRPTTTVHGPGPVKATPNCKPPYVIDERGIKKYKPECL